METSLVQRVRERERKKSKIVYIYSLLFCTPTSLTIPHVVKRGKRMEDVVVVSNVQACKLICK